MKSLREAAAELGMPEAEIRVMVDNHKVRAVWKKGVLSLAPDEIAKLRRQRKTLESALRPGSTPAPPKPAPPKAAAPKTIPPRPAAQPPKRPEAQG
jgi:hypothetical protein